MRVSERGRRYKSYWQTESLLSLVLGLLRPSIFFFLSLLLLASISSINCRLSLELFCLKCILWLSFRPKAAANKLAVGPFWKGVCANRSLGQINGFQVLQNVGKCMSRICECFWDDLTDISLVNNDIRKLIELYKRYYFANLYTFFNNCKYLIK